MKIAEVRVRGFKSLRDLVLRPSSFTVLVGPNNSGKSNIVDALGFLSDVYDVGPKEAIDRRGGFENIAHRRDRDTTQRIMFDVLGEGDVRDVYLGAPILRFGRLDSQNSEGFLERTVFVRHSFTIEGIRRKGEKLVSDFSIVEESITISVLPDDHPALTVKRTGDSAELEWTSDEAVRDVAFSLASGPNAEEFAKRFIDSIISRRELIDKGLRPFSACFQRLIDQFLRLRSYELVPSECRNSTAPNANPILDSRGRNLPALVYYLREQQPRQWKLVMNSMSRIVPDLTDVTVEANEDRMWRLSFREHGSRRRWTAGEVSDGTIRSLAMFASVYDPRASFLVFEEPENSVHPWILRVFVESCREVARSEPSKQLLITSHSPVLINHLRPSDISVVWKEDGATRIAPLSELDPYAETSWEQGSSSLFDLLDSGLVTESVPGN